MDLKAKREEIIAQVQRNKQDIMNHEKHLEGLRNGAVYLSGQLNLIDSFLKAEEADKNPASDKKEATPASTGGTGKTASLPSNPLKEAAPKKEEKNENVASGVQPTPVPSDVAKPTRQVRNKGSAAGNNSPS